MLGAQRIYGPHDSAAWDGGDIALGRCLSDSLPEDSFDHQPVFAGDGRFVLVADLRLDNRDELIRALQVAPDRAAALADSALLALAWERWQDDCFGHLVGDYAFAVWDSKQRRLFLARDPFGFRTLHYHRGADAFAFASMPKGLHALPEIPRAPDEERTTEIFALVPEYGSRSFFKDVERVEPGHLIIVDSGGLSRRRHWRPQPSPLRLKSAGEYAEGLRAHLDMAVRARLRGAGGRVGAHLSAGLDSSAVAATAAALLAPSGGKVVAFTAVPRKGYAGAQLRGRFGDEGPLAAATAARYPNIEHVLIHTDARSPLDNMDRNFFLFERPLINICNQVWYDAMHESAKARGLTVMLGAPMGNLSMSYDGMTLLPRLLATGHWVRWLAEVRALARTRNRSWTSSLAASFGPWIPAPLWSRLRRAVRGGFGDANEVTAINKATFQARTLDRKASDLGMDASLRPRANGVETRIWAYDRTDLGNYFKGWLGGWGIDVRDPSADRRLVEFCLSVPDEQYLSDGVPRALARRAFAGLLPAAVLAERRRGLQAADWHEGATAARAGIRAEIDRLEDNLAAATALDIAQLRAFEANWPTDGWENEMTYATYRLGLLRAISAGHFLRKASGGNA